MKRFPFWILFTILVLLAGCNQTPIPLTQVTTAAATPTALPANATVMPELDLSVLPAEFPESMKGYELLSWQNDGVWWYTLVTGTNRQKTFEELVSTQSWFIPNEYMKITTNSLDDLEAILQRLPQGSEVFWGGMELTGEVDKDVIYFTYPPEKILAEITAVCKENNLQLTTLEKQE